MKTQMPAISSVVPIYNAARYLQRCLDSLIRQTFQDFEIVAINDGSTDDNLSILNDNARKDPRIRIFSKNNEGLSAARNLGMQRAIGKHITFVDEYTIIHDLY